MGLEKKRNDGDAEERGLFKDFNFREITCL